MFKIVQTIEKGRRELTIVPSAWEADGQLYWPKIKADKLVKISDSVPEDNWFQMKCKLKRSHLINYEIGEEELERMLDKDETEREEKPINVMNRTVLLPIGNNRYEDDFNTLTRTCMVSDKTSQRSSVQTLNENITQASNFYQYDTNILEDQSLTYEKDRCAQNSIIYMTNTTESNNCEPMSEDSATVTNHFPTSIKCISEELNNILDNQKTIIENQTIIAQKLDSIGTNENQIAIMQRLAKIETMFNAVVASNSTFNKKCTCQDTTSAVSKDDVDAIEPIHSLADLIKLEEDLGDTKVMENMVQRLSHICGRRGSGNGLNNCYILVDRLFSRKFMTLCSWAGGARDQKEKIPFKIYKKTIQLFFKVIHLSDADFSYSDCEAFLKNVIRNSTRRSESNMIRSSSIKRRPKSLSYKVPKKQQNRNEMGDTEEETGSNTVTENIEKRRLVESDNEKTNSEVETVKQQ